MIDAMSVLCYDLFGVGKSSQLLKEGMDMLEAVRDGLLFGAVIIVSVAFIAFLFGLLTRLIGRSDFFPNLWEILLTFLKKLFRIRKAK